jgi:adenylate kinase
MAPAAIHNPFSLLGLAAGTKLLLPGLSGSPAETVDRACSLHFEHVSPEGIAFRGISRPAPGAVTSAHPRRCFFARKPDAGFALADFPATLLQAMDFN